MGLPLRIVAATAALAAVVFIGSVAAYDPWRIRRVRNAVRPGATWAGSVAAAEAAAFPESEPFRAMCVASPGAAAHFVREDGVYTVAQYGQVMGPAGPAQERVLTSTDRFANRSSWATAVAELGTRLRCESLVIVFPFTDASTVRLSAQGTIVTAEPF
jgi:hypothetical protein